MLSLQVTLLALAFSQNAPLRYVRQIKNPHHLLVVLGSGGHTTEMVYLLEKSLDVGRFVHRTYVVTSQDKFSANKALAFERKIAERQAAKRDGGRPGTFDIVTIPRARRVHQSYWTSPFTTLQCLWACLLVLQGRYPEQKELPPMFKSPKPDCILTNGPAVAVCMVLAAKIIRVFDFIRRWTSARGSVPEPYRLRTIYVESWARIKALSTSGVLLLPLVDKFLVQWPDLAGRRAWWGMKKTEYAGWAVL